MNKLLLILLLIHPISSVAKDLCDGYQSNVELCEEYFKKKDPCKFYFDRTIDDLDSLGYEAASKKRIKSSTIKTFLNHANKALDTCGERLSYKQRKYIAKKISAAKRAAKR